MLNLRRIVRSACQSWLFACAAAFALLGAMPASGQCGSALQDRKVINDQSSVFEVEYGNALDSDGSTLVVGVYKSDFGAVDMHGLAYVYTRVGTAWVEQARLIAPDGASNDLFGTSVSVSGDTIAVGAPQNDAVYVFRRSGSTWTLSQTLTLGTQSGFGFDVDLNGPYLAVGAPLFDSSGLMNVGRAYVYSSLLGGSYSLESTLSPSVASDGARFGYSVSLSGVDLAVGQRGSGDMNSTTDLRWNSCVRMYRRVLGTWSPQIELRAFSPQQFDQFGYCVALLGDTLVVGLPGYKSTPTSTNAGAAYVFTRTNSSSPWLPQQQLIPDDSKQDFRFGEDVAITSSSLIAVACPGWLSGPVTVNARGAVYTFNSSGGAWSPQHLIPYPESLEYLDGFAGAITATPFGTGMRLTVGAHRQSGPNRAIGGAIYEFDALASSVTLQQHLFEPIAFQDRFGAAVAVDGEWAVVGVPDGNLPGSNNNVSMSIESGFAGIYRKVNGVWTFHSSISDTSLPAGSHFGAAVAIDGNTIVVGAPDFDFIDIDLGSNTDSGLVEIFVFDGTSWVRQALIENPAPINSASGDQFGYSVSIRGDLVLIGIPGDDTNGSNAGYANTFSRTAGVWGDRHVVSPPDGAAGDQFGNSCAIIGAAGVGAGTYIVVGAYGDDDQGTNSGSATAFVTSPIIGGFFWDDVRKFVPADGALGDNFATSISAAGNVIVFGSPLEDGAGTDRGAAYIFRNTGIVNPNWGTGVKITPTNPADNNRFGWSVATTGSGVVIGSPQDDDTGGGTDAGSAYIFRLVSSTWSEIQRITAADFFPGDDFGRAVAMSSDTILVGAPKCNTEFGADAGAAYFFGTPLATPTVTMDPVDQNACPGNSVQFSVAVAGGGPYTFAWRRNGVALVDDVGVVGSATPTLTLSAINGYDQAAYSVAVTTACGAVVSTTADLTICYANFNCQSGVTVQDIFDYLAVFFSGDPIADVNGANGVSVQDIFDFLTSWFTGC